MCGSFLNTSFFVIVVAVGLLEKLAMILFELSPMYKKK